MICERSRGQLSEPHSCFLLFPFRPSYFTYIPTVPLFRFIFPFLPLLFLFFYSPFYPSSSSTPSMADDAAAGAVEQRPTPPPPETANAAKTLITIPSYPPASSSASSSSSSNAFSKAFSFIKSSEFYTPPTAENAPRCDLFALSGL